jgi:hypothetical protein
MGHKCSSALSAKMADMRSFSLPFDWCEHLFPKKVIDIFSNNFEDFIPDTFANLVREGNSNVFYYKNKYDVHICHIDVAKADEIIAGYKRRVLRAIDILNSDKNVCFLYINEGYLWNKDFRDETFNKQTFSELVELDTFIQIKYPNLKYTIIFIDFVKHDVPTPSNILQIVIKSKQLYDVHIDGAVDYLRLYCSKILQAIVHK